AHGIHFLLAGVCHLDVARGCRRTAVPDSHGRTTQSDANRRRRSIQLAVISSRQNAVLGRLSGQRFRIERANQQPRDGRIAIRDVEVVRRLGYRVTTSREAHSTGRFRIEVHAVKSGIVVAPAFESADRIDADAVQTVRSGLVKRYNAWMNLHEVEQKILVTDSR